MPYRIVEGKEIWTLSPCRRQDGRHPREADVVRIFISDEEVSSVIDKVVKWYQENGKRGEALA